MIPRTRDSAEKDQVLSNDPKLRIFQKSHHASYLLPKVEIFKEQLQVPGKFSNMTIFVISISLFILFSAPITFNKRIKKEEGVSSWRQGRGPPSPERKKDGVIVVQ